MHTVFLAIKIWNCCALKYQKRAEAVMIRYVEAIQKEGLSSSWFVRIFSNGRWRKLFQLKSFKHFSSQWSTVSIVFTNFCCVWYGWPSKEKVYNSINVLWLVFFFHLSCDLKIFKVFSLILQMNFFLFSATAENRICHYNSCGFTARKDTIFVR